MGLGIDVEGRRIRKEKVADSKVSVNYTFKGPLNISSPASD